MDTNPLGIKYLNACPDKSWIQQRETERKVKETENVFEHHSQTLTCFTEEMFVEHRRNSMRRSSCSGLVLKDPQEDDGGCFGGSVSIHFLQCGKSRVEIRTGLSLETRK